MRNYYLSIFMCVLLGFYEMLFGKGCFPLYILVDVTDLKRVEQKSIFFSYYTPTRREGAILQSPCPFVRLFTRS